MITLYARKVGSVGKIICSQGNIDTFAINLDRITFWKETIGLDYFWIEIDFGKVIIGKKIEFGTLLMEKKMG